MNGTALRLLALAGAAALLAACTTVGPDYRVPEHAAVNRAGGGFQQATTSAAVSLDPLPPQWWRLYRSEELDRLVGEALAANDSLRVAEAHLRRANAQAAMVEGERDPHVGAVAAVKRARESGESFLIEEQLPVANEGELALQVSWQLDLWGQLKRGEEAAAADVQAVEAARDVARVSVVAQTVQAWLQVCQAQAQQRVAERGLAVQQRTLDLAQRLAEAGRGTSSEVLRAEGLVDMQRAGLPRWQAEREAGLYRLAALLGRTPQEFDAGAITCATPPELTKPLPVGDGTALLKRRPDVRQAERQAAAASARIGVATALLYPSIQFGASAGVVGIAEHLGQPATQTWGFGPLIHWRIPDAGARARVKMAEADEQAALAHFDGVVLNALAETETALSRYRHDLERRASQRAARDAAAALAAEQKRYVEAGRRPYASSLDAQRTLTSAEATLAAADAEIAQDQLRLFMTLGGGWE
ncbi:efflux transporter outer membrane subunit [Pelomonas sp. KK5]|uniref:efflux transporter outer membrane subunit n=1 Tax=Pelomonas sp. KK5 TaxID=1855730 RepID=UPI00097C7F5E|nr:efflux transporter outer membrane subunit [Pelomonas sp. KK5]